MAVSETWRCFKVTPETRDRMVDILGEAINRESNVRVAFLFGSFARGEPFMDIDIAVELDEPFKILDLGAIAGRLWSAAGRPGHEIDVVPLNDASPSFRLHVAGTGVLLRERHKGDAVEFEVRARTEQFDFEEATRIMAAEEAGRS